MKRLYQFVCQAEAVVGATFLVLMVALIFLGSVARSMHHPLNWTTDAATAFFAWGCFLCADVAWRKNSLMSIDIATALLPPWLQTWMRQISHAIIAAFLVYLIGAGTYLSWISRARSFQGIPDVSYSWVTMSLPVGALLLLVTTVLKVREDFRNGALRRAPRVRPVQPATN